MEKKKKKVKAKTADVQMVLVPPGYDGYSYAPLDADSDKILGKRPAFTAPIPVFGRSMPQNSLWAVWYGIIGKQTGQSPLEVKCECKLMYGVPILRAASAKFRQLYDSTIKPLSYEVKLELMEDLVKVTSLLSRHQGIEYTETLQRVYANQNIRLVVL